MDFEVRVPCQLLVAEMPHWHKAVWISIRSCQGNGAACRASLRFIGERAAGLNGAMDKGQVHAAIQQLIKDGWLEKHGPNYVCTVPDSVKNVEQGSTSFTESVEQGSTASVKNVEQDSTTVEQDSTVVEQGSTRSENQLENQLENQHSLPRAREEWAVSSWNELAGRFNLPTCRRLNAKRRAGIRKRGDEIQAHWSEIVHAFHASSFLRGEEGAWGGASFDFLYCRTDAVDKILEGQYADKGKNGNSYGTPSKQADRRTAAERSNQLDGRTVARRLENAYTLLERDPGEE